MFHTDSCVISPRLCKLCQPKFFFLTFLVCLGFSFASCCVRVISVKFLNYIIACIANEKEK